MPMGLVWPLTDRKENKGMLTAEQMKAEVETRLLEIENRIAWLAEREFSGAGGGRGADTQARLVREIRRELAELRAALELPPASEPAFDESLFR
jgi:hypothetical protein